LCDTGLSSHACSSLLSNPIEERSEVLGWFLLMTAAADCDGTAFYSE